MNNTIIIERLSDKLFPFPVRIECTGSIFIEIKELKEFQEELKKREEKDIARILKSIRDYGFSFPFFFWQQDKKKYVFDGHGRLQALKKLEELGGEIPQLPACEVKAKNKKEAKQKLLRLNSKYGKIDTEGLKDFIMDLHIDFDDLELPDIEELHEEDRQEKDTDFEYEEKEEDIEEYKKMHVLLSFHPKLFSKVKIHLEKIIAIEGIEYEQSAN